MNRAAGWAVGALLTASIAWGATTGLKRSVLERAGATGTQADAYVADDFLGRDNAALLRVSVPVTGADASTHEIYIGIDGEDWIGCSATGDGAGGVVAATALCWIGDGTTPLELSGSIIQGLDAMEFEGFTDDSFSTTLRIVDPTADRVVSMPNVTGTLITTGDTGTVTGTMLASDYSGVGACAANTLASTLNEAAAPTCSGVGNLSLDAGVSLSSNSLAADVCAFPNAANGGGMLCEGVTADANEILWDQPDCGADVTLTPPCTTGTLVASGDTGTVTAALELDTVRCIPLPLLGWVECTGSAASITVGTSGVDTSPDCMVPTATAIPTDGCVITWDDTSGSLDVNSLICYGGMIVPLDYVSGAYIAARVDKDGSGGASNSEILNCGFREENEALDVTGAVNIDSATLTGYTCTPAGTLTAGNSVVVVLKVTSGTTMNDYVELYSASFCYTAAD